LQAGFRLSAPFSGRCRIGQVKSLATRVPAIAARTHVLVPRRRDRRWLVRTRLHRRLIQPNSLLAGVVRYTSTMPATFSYAGSIRAAGL
jgi:hypothetical protein